MPSNPPLRLPSAPRNKRGARLTPASVASALTELGITAPVDIRWNNGMRTRGSHRCKPGYMALPGANAATKSATFFHQIYLSHRLDAEQASITLWHELVHALQVESFVKDFGDAVGLARFNAAYLRETADKSYRANRFEVEARESADRLHAALPLANQKDS